MKFASYALRCALCCFLMASAAVAADARLSGPPVGTVRSADPVPPGTAPATPAPVIIGVERPAPLANGPVVNGTLTPLPAGPGTTLPVITAVPTIVTPPTGVAVIGPAGTTAGANVSNQFHSLTQMPAGSVGTNMPILQGPPGSISPTPPPAGAVVIVPASPASRP